MPNDKRIVLWPDTHVPDHHPKAVENIIQFIGEYEPDEVCFLGDFYDFKAPARWSRDTADECGLKLQHEVNVGSDLLGRFRDAYSGPATITLGNHEDRLENYLKKYAKAVYGVDALDTAQFGHFNAFDITVKPQPYSIGPGVRAIHGGLLGPTAGASAIKELNRQGHSIVQGHSHRLGLLYKTTDKSRFAMECGWLGDIRKAAYLNYGVADWRTGFGLLTVSRDRAYPSLVSVDPGGAFLVEGKWYGRANAA